MRKSFSLFTCLICFFTNVNAQGIYRFWGTAENGGRDGIGSIFSLDASGDNFQRRHHFKINSPGSTPKYAELTEYNGRFYSVTSRGGKGDGGVIFEWNPATNIYSKKFDFINDGNTPTGSLTLMNGKFYGMTSGGGGLNGTGVIYEWDPATGSYSRLYDFENNTGRNPAGSLTAYNGKLYGMTVNGGSNGQGVIFEYDPTGNAYTKKIDFTGSNGGNPYGNLLLISNKFYGITYSGGANNRGVIFEWDPATNTYTKKIDCSATGGSNPYGSLVYNNGKCYGMTYAGGTAGKGVIFEWDPATNSYAKKIDFNGTNGSNPYGNLSWNNGKFYGLTYKGGSGNSGVIFEWDPASGSISIKKEFFSSSSGLPAVNDGYYPYGTLTFMNGLCYGMTSSGGSQAQGVIFEFDLSGNTYSKKIDFNGNRGQNPGGNLTMHEGRIYGMTGTGGTYGSGVIFELDPETMVYTKKKDFNSVDGTNPTGNLVSFNGKLYGTATGGTNDAGVIFEWDPVTNNYIKKFELNNAEGNTPQGSMLLLNGRFYGMAISGGANDLGVIFEWDPATNIYTKKIDFTGANGSYPNGSLIAIGGKCYGMTLYGGAHDKGVIFEWDPASNNYSIRIDFDGTNGSYPFGNLSLHNGKCYGMTNGLEGQNGSTSKGVIFEWDPSSNAYTKKHEFNGTDGRAPTGSLSLSNGKFYGLTMYGGNSDAGVAFEWDPATNTYTKKHDFDFDDGINPRRELAPLPVLLSNGVANTCTAYPSVTINSSNNNVWVPITDETGNAIAEIKANGNNLGTISTTMYINGGPVRETSLKKLYLDRSFTFTPSVQPSTPVDVRFYIKKSEYLALKNGINSIGQPSYINSINDVGIFKNNDSCSGAVVRSIIPVSSTAGNWETDYVFTASVNSFSSFYFFSLTQGGPLALADMAFSGRAINNNAELKWVTTNEINTRSFTLEKSTDGANFETVATVPANNRPGTNQYQYTDLQAAKPGVTTIFYRLKQQDNNGRFSYSEILALNFAKNKLLVVYPNPSGNEMRLTVNMEQSGKAAIRISDNLGRTVKQEQLNLAPGSNTVNINITGLQPGMYNLQLQADSINEHARIIKQ